MANAGPRSEAVAAPTRQPPARTQREVVGALPWHGVLVVTAIAFAILVLLAAIVPYHIDELRQVALYRRDLAAIPRATLEMQQPPLDTLANALVHRLLGAGDIRERLLPILFGCASLLLLGRLCLAAGLRWGAVIAVGTLALLPIFLRTTPYARQYALPTFLMLLVLYSVDRWLHRGKQGWLWATGLASVLLVLSRSVDPVLFLVTTAAVLATVGYLERHRLPSGWRSVRVPMAITAGMALLVGGPVTILLQGYTRRVGLSGDGPPLLETLARMMSESAEALSDAAALARAGGAIPRRRLLTSGSFPLPSGVVDLAACGDFGAVHGVLLRPHLGCRHTVPCAVPLHAHAGRGRDRRCERRGA